MDGSTLRVDVSVPKTNRTLNISLFELCTLILCLMFVIVFIKLMFVLFLEKTDTVFFRGEACHVILCVGPHICDEEILVWDIPLLTCAHACQRRVFRTTADWMLTCAHA